MYLRSPAATSKSVFLSQIWTNLSNDCPWTLLIGEYVNAEAAAWATNSRSVLVYIVDGVVSLDWSFPMVLEAHAASPGYYQIGKEMCMDIE